MKRITNKKRIAYTRKYLAKTETYTRIMYKANEDCWYGIHTDTNNPYVQGDTGYRFIGSTADIIRMAGWE